MNTPPREWDADTIEAQAKHLAATMTTAGLREFQSLNVTQIGMAYKQRNTAALDNLRTMADVYARAVTIKEFPNG